MAKEKVKVGLYHHNYGQDSFVVNAENKLIRFRQDLTRCDGIYDTELARQLHVPESERLKIVSRLEKGRSLRLNFYPDKRLADAGFFIENGMFIRDEETGKKETYDYWAREMSKRKQTLEKREKEKRDRLKRECDRIYEAEDVDLYIDSVRKRFLEKLQDMYDREERIHAERGSYPTDSFKKQHEKLTRRLEEIAEGEIAVGGLDKEETRLWLESNVPLKMIEVYMEKAKDAEEEGEKEGFRKKAFSVAFALKQQMDNDVVERDAWLIQHPDWRTSTEWIVPGVIEKSEEKRDLGAKELYLAGKIKDIAEIPATEYEFISRVIGNLNFLKILPRLCEIGGWRSIQTKLGEEKSIMEHYVQKIVDRFKTESERRRQIKPEDISRAEDTVLEIELGESKALRYLVKQCLPRDGEFQGLTAVFEHLYRYTNIINLEDDEIFAGTNDTTKRFIAEEFRKFMILLERHLSLDFINSPENPLEKLLKEHPALPKSYYRVPEKPEED